MTNKDKIIEEILNEYKRKGKVTQLMNDMTFHAEEDLDLEELLYDFANRHQALAEKGLIKIEKVNNLKKRLKDNVRNYGVNAGIIDKDFVLNEIDKLFSEEIGSKLLEGENDIDK